jgi:opacity protein-like surface antigen
MPADLQFVSSQNVIDASIRRVIWALLTKETPAMKRLLIAATIVAATLSAPASAQVSVSIGQPGFYGRLDIGGFPPPPLLFPEPVMIQPVPVGRPPLYLRVPPGHAKNWHRYCRRYGACGERVYFVQDNWYRHEYAPRYQERHGHRGYDRDGYRDGYRGDDRGYDRRDYRDDDRGRGRGEERGRGHGPGHDHDR